MAKRIYVGNLPFATTSDDLLRLFSQHGAVDSAQVISDKYTGKSRGFGFIEMPNDGEADAAIAALNGHNVGDRALTVNEARPREEGGGGRRGGYGGGGRGGRDRGDRGERRY